MNGELVGGQQRREKGLCFFDWQPAVKIPFGGFLEFNDFHFDCDKRRILSGLRLLRTSDAEKGHEHDAHSDQALHSRMRRTMFGNGLNAGAQGGTALEDADESET